MKSMRIRTTALLALLLILVSLVSGSVGAQSPDDEEYTCGVPEWVIEWEQQQIATQSQLSAMAYSYPPAIDWRNRSGYNWTTPIKDQGGCGSCSAFAVAGAIESRYKIAYNSPGANPDLSEAQLFFCNGGICTIGIWQGTALNTAQNDGVADEACFPYTDHNQGCSLCSNWQSRVTKITCWRGTADVGEMKYQIATYGPIVVSMRSYQDFNPYYSGGIYRHTWGAFRAYHAVALVGYNDPGGYWIGKNSWGTWWGESGWFRIAYGEVGIDDYAYLPHFDRVAPFKASNVQPSGWAGPYTNDTTPSFRWNGADDDADGCGVTGYYVAVDDWTPDGESGNDWWVGGATVWTVPNPLPDGQHIFAVTARDKGGNVNPINTNRQGDAPYYTFYVDTTAPTNPTTANSGCNAQNGIWQNTCNDPNFTWSGATDATSGVDSYQVYWGTDPNGTAAFSTTSPGYNPSAVSTGAYYLRVRTRDKVSNWSNWTTLYTFRYDNLAPSGSFSFSGGELSYTINMLLNLNGADVGSGVSRVRLSNDGTNWTEKAYASQVNWIIPATDGQWHTVYLRFVDAAGNVSPVCQQQICLDLTPPKPSSTNYRLWPAGQIAGGGYASAGYRLYHTEGQPFARHPQVSSGYRLHSGFQATWPASPGAELFTASACAAAPAGEGKVYLPIITKNP